MSEIVESAWDGVPANPEVSGWHWVQRQGYGPRPVKWIADGERGLGWGGYVTTDDRYLGPCLTPDAITTLTAERDAALAEVARLREALERIANMAIGPYLTDSPDFGSGYDMAAESAADTAREALRHD
jgi:hypothetical protein